MKSISIQYTTILLMISIEISTFAGHLTNDTSTAKECERFLDNLGSHPQILSSQLQELEKFKIGEYGLPYITTSLRSIADGFNGNVVYDQLLSALALYGRTNIDSQNLAKTKGAQEFYYQIFLDPPDKKAIQLFHGRFNFVVELKKENEQVLKAAEPLRRLGNLIAHNIQSHIPELKNTTPLIVTLLSTNETTIHHSQWHDHRAHAVLVANIQLIPEAEGIEIEGTSGPQPYGTLTIFQNFIRHRMPPRIHRRLSLVIFFTKPKQRE